MKKKITEEDFKLKIDISSTKCKNLIPEFIAAFDEYREGVDFGTDGGSLTSFVKKSRGKLPPWYFVEIPDAFFNERMSALEFRKACLNEPEPDYTEHFIKEALAFHGYSFKCDAEAVEFARTKCTVYQFKSAKTNSNWNQLVVDEVPICTWPDDYGAIVETEKGFFSILERKIHPPKKLP